MILANLEVGPLKVIKLEIDSLEVIKFLSFFLILFSIFIMFFLIKPLGFIIDPQTHCHLVTKLSHWQHSRSDTYLLLYWARYQYHVYILENFGSIVTKLHQTHQNIVTH